MTAAGSDAEAIRLARLRLLDVAERGTLAEVLVATLDELEALSGSCIGFYHFLEADQETLTLQAWSTRTSRDYCKAEGHGSHYPMTSAGVWADAVRLRRPVVHNDYASLPLRKGMPPGHAQLVRELVVPVLRGDRVTAILGVGNKACDYTEADLHTVVTLADLAWEIADNKRIRETLQFEEAALEYSLNAVALAHPDGRIRYVNPAYVALRGHQDRYKCLGLNLWAFWADPAVAEALRHQLLEDGKAVEGEMEALHYNGTPFTAHFTASLAKDALGNPLGILGTFLDETARKRTEVALQEREFFFKESQRAAAIGSYKTDFQAGRWQSSAVLDHLFGIDETYDRTIPNWLQIVHPDDRAMMGRYLAEEVIAKRLPFRKEYRIQRPSDGETRGVNGQGEVSFDTDGNLMSLIGTIQDITERRLRDEELRLKNEEMERFTFMISHDLKGPLVTVQTFLGYLEQDLAKGLPERVDKDMGFIRDAAGKMGRLLEDLLEVSRVGRVVTPPVRVTFQDLARETLKALGGAIATRGTQVQVLEGDVALLGDRPRLEEVWQNLTENALKYLGDQPAPRIELGFETLEAGTVFWVKDNGMGIDPRFHDKIFGLFDQLDPASEGTGLGLALVKRIVELYGGRIWVASEGLGLGTCFRFTLPEALKGATHER